MEVYKKLKRLRNDLGLSQMAFSETIGVSLETYTDYEGGRRGTPRYVIARIGELYGVDPKAFADPSSDVYRPESGLPEKPSRPKKERRRKALNEIERGWPSMPERCQTCIYRVQINKRAVGCGFAAEARALRGCPIGDECTRYVRDTSTRRISPLRW